MEPLCRSDDAPSRWIKAEASLPGGMCVEVAAHGDSVAVRQSRSPEEGTLYFTRDEFAAFLSGAKAGEFDHLIEVPAPRGLSNES